VRPDAAVQANDLLPGLLDRGPHVGVRLGVLVQPRQRLAERPAERLAEIPRLDTGHVLDEAEQVGAGRHQRAANVVLREPVQLPQQSIASALEIVAEVGLGV
jgi:hypothetical protein